LKNNNLKFVPLTLAVAALAACGGGGGGGTDPVVLTPVVPTVATLQGTVVDGAITGATVFLDINNNLTLDNGEPNTTSGAEGKFTLDIKGLTAAQVKASHIVTIVPAGAKDSDDGGKTLTEAGKLGFTMMAPAAAYAQADGTATGAVVSPITTLLSHDMLSDGSKSLAAATAAVQSRLGLASSVSLTQDPSQNADLKVKAQVIAAAIGQVKAIVQTSAAGTSDRDALFAAITYLQQHVAQLQQAVDDAIAAAAINAKPSAANAVKTLVAGGGSAGSTGTNSSLVPTAATLLATATQTTTGNVSSISAMLLEGGYSGDCLLEEVCNDRPRYRKLSGTASSWMENRFELLGDVGNSEWVASSSSGVSDFSLSASGWVASSSAGSNGTWAPDGLGGLASQSNGRQMRITMRAQDIANKKFGDLTGIAVPAAHANTVFPSGSKAFFTSTSQLADVYKIYPGFIPGSNGGSGGFTGLAALVNAFQTPAADAIGNTSVTGSDGLNFTFNEAASVAIAAGGGTIRLYGCSLGVAAAISGGCSGGSWIAGTSSSYKLANVQGQQILRVNAGYGNSGQKLIFALHNGLVLGGDYTPANAWFGSSVNFNKVAFEAILNAGSKPTTLN
jgi:hypothetical protein